MHEAVADIPKAEDTALLMKYEGYLNRQIQKAREQLEELQRRRKGNSDS